MVGLEVKNWLNVGKKELGSSQNELAFRKKGWYSVQTKLASIGENIDRS